MTTKQAHPYIQVLGATSIVHSENERDLLAGSASTLMALLVAAGPEGVSLTEISAGFWPMERPTVWKPAVQHAISRMRRRLPQGWELDEHDGLVSLHFSIGWIDAWRLEAIVDAVDLHADDLDWILAGPPYEAVAVSGPIAASKRRLRAMQHDIAVRHRQSGDLVSAEAETRSLHPGKPQSTFPVGYRSRAHAAAELRVRSASRTLLIGPEHSGKSETLGRVANARSALESHMVLGDPNLALPLGAFASAFPDLRDALLDITGSNARSLAARAWRVIVEHLAERAKKRPQRILIDDAHALDPTSLILVTMLFQYDAPEPFRIVAAADQDSTDDTWTDFVAMAERDDVQLVTLRFAAAETPYPDRSWLNQTNDPNVEVCV